jgi:hypothetical protein
VHGPKFPGWIAVDSNDPNSARIRYFPPTVVQNKRGFMGLACWAQQYQCGTSINFSLSLFEKRSFNQSVQFRKKHQATKSRQRKARFQLWTRVIICLQCSSLGARRPDDPFRSRRAFSRWRILPEASVHESDNNGLDGTMGGRPGRYGGRRWLGFETRGASRTCAERNAAVFRSGTGRPT